MPRTYITQEEIKRMIDMTTNVRDRLLICMLFHLGYRVSEALVLTTQDIDLDNGTITIQHLKSRINLMCPSCYARLSRSHTFCPNCGQEVKEALTKSQDHRRQRVLPLDTDTMAMLKDYIQRGGPLSRDGKKFIFGINRHRAWQIVKESAEKAGLPKIINAETGKTHNVSPHRLRDSFAVHAMKHDNSGDGLRILQEHLGHQSFNTTAKYRKISGEEHKGWYEKLWHGERDNG